MIEKLAIICFVTFTLFQVQSCRDQQQDDVREIFNVNSEVELLFFFKQEISKVKRDQFYENELMIKTEDGHWVRDGVQATFGIDKNGYEGFGLTFRPDATREQRADIMRRLKESPLVFRIYESVVPNEINDLPGEKKPDPNKTPDTRPTKEVRIANRE